MKELKKFSYLKKLQPILFLMLILNIVNIIPLTSRKEGRTIYPNEVLIPRSKYGLEKESIALCHQIRTIDKKRLSKYYGHLSEKSLQNEVIGALKFQLGIE